MRRRRKGKTFFLFLFKFLLTQSSSSFLATSHSIIPSSSFSHSRLSIIKFLSSCSFFLLLLPIDISSQKSQIIVNLLSMQGCVGKWQRRNMNLKINRGQSDGAAAECFKK